MSHHRSSVRDVEVDSWSALLAAVDRAHFTLDVQDGEILWFRGSKDCRDKLTPSLMRITEGLSRPDHDGIEQSLFFEFQARAAELRLQGLTDWEYLFYGRHYKVPTRLLDWTDTFGIALYFALEDWLAGARIEHDHPDETSAVPAVWILAPYALNSWSVSNRDILLPKYLGLDANRRCRDFGELLAQPGDWSWSKPVAIYPAQINDRVRAQRGWFTIHGADRRPLEVQAPRFVLKLVLKRDCIAEAVKFLELAGLHRFSIFPDLENLALWIGQRNLAWANRRRTQKANRTKTRASRLTIPSSSRSTANFERNG
jgi:hypothetical protein